MEEICRKAVEEERGDLQIEIGTIEGCGEKARQTVFMNKEERFRVTPLESRQYIY